MQGSANDALLGYSSSCKGLQKLHSDLQNMLASVEVKRSEESVCTHTAAHCNALQRCSTLQHTAAYCNRTCSLLLKLDVQKNRCVHTLQHTATHCNTLQRTAAHYNLLQQNMLASVEVKRSERSVGAHTAAHCSTLQRTAAHCNILQHTATKHARFF